MVGTPGRVEASGLIQKVDYRPYRHFNRKHFRRHHVGYPYRHSYRRFHRPYYADDDYVYYRPGVRFGLEVRKHRHNGYHYRY
jgi:hypothetical protein